MLSIGAIDHEGQEEPKPTFKRNQPSTSKVGDKDKDTFDLQSLEKSLKLLTNEVSDLRRKGIDSVASSQNQRPFFRRNAPQNNRPQSNTNTGLNVEEIGKDDFCSFHQASHSERTCPQWINSMTVVVSQLLDDQTPGEVDEEGSSEHDESGPPEEEPGSTVLAVDVI